MKRAPRIAAIQDLSGFGEYRYSLWLTPETDPEKAMDELHEHAFAPYTMITG